MAVEFPKYENSYKVRVEGRDSTGKNTTRQIRLRGNNIEDVTKFIEDAILEKIGMLAAARK
jgi:hypothetical protein